MKKIILLMLLMLPMAVVVQSEEPEKSFPSRDTEIVRRCSLIDIEGEYYHDVVVTLKSYYKESESLLGIKGGYRVKVIVKDGNGKKIYKKTFKNSNLYIFRGGHVQVGKPKFHQMIIEQWESDYWFGKIREKEGIW